MSDKTYILVVLCAIAGILLGSMAPNSLWIFAGMVLGVISGLIIAHILRVK